METYRTLVLAISFLLALEMNVPPKEVEAAEPPAPAVVVSRSDEQAGRLVDWAVARFAQAGLVLPAVTVEVHETKDPCHGHLGLTLNTPDSATVHLCTPGDGRGVVDRLTLVHELAHVWVAGYVSTDSREGFMEVHGLEAWWDAGDGWETQGVEWAAETVAWAVYDEGVRMIGEVDDDLEATHRGYQVLTGRPVPVTTVHDHSLAERAQVLSAGAAPSVDIAALLNPDSLTLTGLRRAWNAAAGRRGLPARLGDWIRGPGSSVVRTSITDAVELVVVVGDTGAVDSVTLVGANSGLCEAYDTLLGWVLLLGALNPGNADLLDVETVEAALVERHGQLRGIVHIADAQ